MHELSFHICDEGSTCPTIMLVGCHVIWKSESSKVLSSTMQGTQQGLPGALVIILLLSKLEIADYVSQ